MFTSSQTIRVADSKYKTKNNLHVLNTSTIL